MLNILSIAKAIDNKCCGCYDRIMENANTFKEHWTGLSAEEKRELARAAQTSVAYLSQLANGHRRAGIEIIANLQRVDSRITADMLRPDLFKVA